MTIDTSGLIFNRTDGAYYSAADLNRVQAFCKTISKAAQDEIANLAQLRESYDVAPSVYSLPDYLAPAVLARSAFAVDETYSISDMDQYLANIQNIVAQFPPDEEISLPESMRFLTVTGANHIEEALKASAENLMVRSKRAETNIIKTAAGFSFSGEIF